jgi:hypothetical protein
MVKKLLGLAFVFVLWVMVGAAQENMASTSATSNSDQFAMRVLYESAFVRALPSEESEAVASVFENDTLQAIGRNADGSWIQVRRPNREVSLGWIARKLVMFTFSLGDLPLTDFTTGVSGTDALYDSGFTVLILTEASLRSTAFFDAERVGIIPLLVTLPALERSSDGRWIRVNYLGLEGWVSSVNISSTQDLMLLPVDLSTVLNTLPVVIIPPEVQLAQANRLTDYATPLKADADLLAQFWAQLASDQTVACDAERFGNYANFTVTTQDLYELPELRQVARRMALATASLNEAAEAMQGCGIFSALEISEGFADAVNASIIFEWALGRMSATRELIATK